MVKGVAKHAVLVRPQDGRAFEQAIFILSEGDGTPVQTPEELLTLAGELADKYSIPTLSPKRRARHAPLFWQGALAFLAGCAATGALWWLAPFGG